MSYTRMLGRLQGAGNTTTLARYLDLLQTAGLIAGLPNHAGAALRRRTFQLRQSRDLTRGVPYPEGARQSLNTAAMLRSKVK